MQIYYNKSGICLVVSNTKYNQNMNAIKLHKYKMVRLGYFGPKGNPTHP